MAERKLCWRYSCSFNHTQSPTAKRDIQIRIGSSTRNIVHDSRRKSTVQSLEWSHVCGRMFRSVIPILNKRQKLEPVFGLVTGETPQVEELIPKNTQKQLIAIRDNSSWDPMKSKNICGKTPRQLGGCKMGRQCHKMVVLCQSVHNDPYDSMPTR
ncbi:PREDICTED: uncharacterized protein LOC109332561 [Lupinus angustifolius]|uniref:uncharacterized protein LOC109332561 n=1 Tax=Lupinus angustifolius TaxID=3871 RepID=UPI00092E7377|nr:PREDICTED: uncharacterized protein LOC109332561 [Lupinus angustifolius]